MARCRGERCLVATPRHDRVRRPRIQCPVLGTGDGLAEPVSSRVDKRGARWEIQRQHRLTVDRSGRGEQVGHRGFGHLGRWRAFEDDVPARPSVADAVGRGGAVPGGDLAPPRHPGDRVAELRQPGHECGVVTGEGDRDDLRMTQEPSAEVTDLRQAAGDQRARRTLGRGRLDGGGQARPARRRHRERPDEHECA